MDHRKGEALVRRAGLALALSLAAVGANGCAEEREPINRVQPNALAKSFFIGEDFVDTGDDPAFYARAVITDVGYGADGPTPEVRALYRGADALLHDCTYTPADQARRQSRGFSSYEQAADAAIAAGARRLIPFHYDQDYSDADVDALAAACRAYLDAHGGAAIELIPAAEGRELSL